MTFLADIARRLNDAGGVKPSQSPQWTQTSVYDLLRKERIHVARSGARHDARI